MPFLLLSIIVNSTSCVYLYVHIYYIINVCALLKIKVIYRRLWFHNDILTSMETVHCTSEEILSKKNKKKL